MKNLGIGARAKYFACFTYFIYSTDTRRVANGIIIDKNIIVMVNYCLHLVLLQI